MFFFFAVTEDSRSLGRRFCRRMPCCGMENGMAEIVCLSRKFLFFFFSLFRFGKRYFATCPGCGAVFEVAREEGKRLERDSRAEVEPRALRPVPQSGGRFCAGCGARVQPGASYCPYCGRRL